jgi:hypothetical protein
MPATKQRKDNQMKDDIKRLIAIGLIGTIGITATLSRHPEIRHLLDKDSGTIRINTVQVVVSGTVGSTLSSRISFISGKRASELPPVSIDCHSCDHEMKLISVVPDGEAIVYAYQCDNGHRHEIVATEGQARLSGKI